VALKGLAILEKGPVADQFFDSIGAASNSHELTNGNEDHFLAPYTTRKISVANVIDSGTRF